VLPEPTARLRFRPMETADLDDMTAVLSAPDPVRVDRPARTREDAVRWIAWQARNYAEHDFGLWVVQTHVGEFVGDCGLTMQDVEGTPHVEVGYHVMPAMRRHGYATEAATAVRDCAAAAGIAHLIALIRPENLPSQGVARNLGMQVERTAFVHGAEALVFGCRLERPS
jgi:RimJ/RimL family protein N-acetyltransferase